MCTAVRQDLSLKCGGTDVKQPGDSQPGHLRALLGFTLPSVYASDSSTQILPKHIGKPEFPDTGWDRIKDLFYNVEGQYTEELRNVVKSGIASAIVGMIYGGLPGARHARQRFIQCSQAEIYRNRVDAVRAAHNAAIRGFLRFGWRWSWRVAAFVTLFNTVNTGLTVYRDQNALSHFAVSGAVTGGVFRLNLGLRGLLSGTIIGVILGFPAGVLILGLQNLGGETMRDKRRRERRELHELRVTEWNARLKVTDDLIGEMSSLKHQDSEIDLQQVEELLSQPRNGNAAKGPYNQ
ncbi:complex I assembly factor TIMMDC1, mitochondrial [Danio rerio]|uniref:Complex I assembly factor TIMMDC1, mitochondrial n=1 Tax=Danio rerio TaxID=7955 RepID=TIDC1_DANRE|nr:complex I assembly factor TIMMDC1, mitochondrial [Danio rerio]Q568N3.1 RecName: Full=Complex I assembly factor TIMMDC1, mitochondrial; AltName: Full=Translocase of inner mitochondrial membrane domain-containing protein 1; Short=TIMM domain containing-protein 1 [Danio rerio]AAH92788.1 Zgc:110196 [Danio rerio]|eukprot:NP_001017828.1 complex I assembly factor TIMMDC1, mitochondrial [Danio rerio]